jgi:precorrin-6Y C5,15-methyltransferase (decarboxylating)
MDGKVMIFAGTVEGRRLAEILGFKGVPTVICVATDYGRVDVGDIPHAKVSVGPLGHDRMLETMKDGVSVVIDATHPYARQIKAHVREACAEADVRYIRLSREEGDVNGVTVVADIDAAVEYLRNKDGRILVTTGSKEVAKYAAIPDYRERVFCRVLPTADSLRSCADAGIQTDRIIAMQGPFGEELNYGTIRQIGAKFLVTKDSGAAGGLMEKISAAERAGIEVVMVGRPEEIPGAMSFGEVLNALSAMYGLKIENERRTVTVIGIGTGRHGDLTFDADRDISDADLLIGAKRMLASVSRGQDTHEEYRTAETLAYIDSHPEYRKVAILVSGDIGFYSAAKGITAAIDRDRYEVRADCGISSVVHFCASIGESWDDAILISAHGREVNFVGELKRSRKVIVLLNGSEGAKSMCGQLSEYGMGETVVIIGSDLGQENEKIVRGTAANLDTGGLGRLCIAMLLNGTVPVSPLAMVSIDDAIFQRGKAPMTKSEVRALSVAKLKLNEDSVVYDVGAGTGSVSVEMALLAYRGKVFAIEKEHEACGLIRENSLRFGTPNVVTVEGLAPEAMSGLPEPTHVFIGGSSGNLESIIAAVVAKNPRVRMVITAVTIETMAEISRCISAMGIIEESTVTVSVAEARRIGGYHLMTAQNPVLITVCTGPGPSV